MSRSKTGGKGVGYEYWSKRPTSNKGGSPPGKYIKKRTHKAERLDGKAEVRKETNGK